MTFEVHSYNKGHESFLTLRKAVIEYLANTQAHRILFVLPSGEVIKIEDKKLIVNTGGVDILINK